MKAHYYGFITFSIQISCHWRNINLAVCNQYDVEYVLYLVTYDTNIGQSADDRSANLMCNILPKEPKDTLLCM